VTPRARTIAIFWAAAALAAAADGCCNRCEEPPYELQGFEVERASEPVPPPRAPTKKVQLLSPAQLARQIRQKRPMALVFVASKEEYNRGHIAGSLLVPVMALRAAADGVDPFPEINHGRLPRPDEYVVGYCWWNPCECPSVPTYAGLAARILLQKGYQNVAILDGGMRAWVPAGLPVEKPPPAKP